MFKTTLKCPEGCEFEKIAYAPIQGTSCPEHGFHHMSEQIKVEEIGLCKDCKDLDSLEWFPIEEDSPHHGSETDCETCGAKYYDAGDGYYHMENEQAKKNFNGLTKF